LIPGGTNKRTSHWFFLSIVSTMRINHQTD